MAGLVPAIHAFTALRRPKTWMLGTRTGMAAIQHLFSTAGGRNFDEPLAYGANVPK